MADKYPTGIGSQADTSFYIRFAYNGVRYKETIKLPPTKQNLRYGVRLRDEILQKIALGTFDYRAYFPKNKRVIKQLYGLTPTFGEIAEAYLKQIEATKKPSTHRKYVKLLNKWWLPEFAERDINSIKPSEIGNVWHDIDLAPKSMNDILIPIRGVFEIALMDGLIPANPTARFKNIKNQTEEPDPFSLQEVHAILGKMRELYHPMVANYFQFAFFTGVRSGELIELKWTDIDRQFASISRTRVDGYDAGTVKTYKRRLVELNDFSREALQLQREHTALRNEYVFLNPKTMKPWNDYRAQSRLFWNPVLKLLNLRQRRPYETRHTFATLCLMTGANPMWVANQLGHSNMKMVLEVYSKWILKADQSSEVNKINSLKNDGIAQKLSEL